MNRVNVAVLGATGIVGQTFLWLLARHEWFTPVYLAGSERRREKIYGNVTPWRLPVPMPENIGDLPLHALDLNECMASGARIIFSALPSNVSADVEPALRKRGLAVFSNAGAMRRAPDVPILIPEVNTDALDLIHEQGYPDGGFIVTNANCSTTGLAVALAPLRVFGIEEVFVSTYQSLSGAGYPGIPSLDISDSVIPFIPGEEEKIASELREILAIESAVHSTCVRVPVRYGHLETLWVRFAGPVGREDILEAWRGFRSETVTPLTPSTPVLHCEEDSRPRPDMSFFGEPPGMQVFTGRVREREGLIGFVLLVNNLVKGAAGGSVQNAEFFLQRTGGGS